MLAKLKKGGQSPSAMLAVSLNAPTPPTNTPSGKSKKSRREKKKKHRKKKRKEKSQESSEDENPAEASVTQTPTQQLLGQVTTSRPNPTGFAFQILNCERPDLIVTSKLTPVEIQLLDEHLIRKGAFQVGNTISLGKVVDVNSKIQVGSGDDVEVGALQAYGRFGALYLVYKDNDDELEKRGMGILALKMSRRHLAATRIKHEIKILEHFYSSNNRKNVAYPKHITPLFFHGTAGGTPYLIMPMMDVNLEKIREEMGGKIAACDAFYIAQEVLMGIKECHAHSIIHRDIKPTNVLLGIQNNKNWWICDFGDACSAGGRRVLSPPDSFTLPFLSRDAHFALKGNVAATVKMDVESWFYMVLDLFLPLPWKSQIEEPQVLQLKQTFWQNPDAVLLSEQNKLPVQLQKLAHLANSGHIDDQIYSNLTVILKEAFHKTVEAPWKPGWLEKRKRVVVPMKKVKTKKKS